MLALRSIPAAFTAEGAASFANDTTGSLYKAGDAIDPLTLSVAVDKDATLPVTGTGGTGGTGLTAATVGGSLAATGAEIPATALLGASGAAVAAGAGAVYLARRRRTDLR